MGELMDDPDCSKELLLRTIRQLASINRLVARYRTILKRRILHDMLKEPDRSYHLVDMGAGGCDIDAWLLRAARKLGLTLRITAVDIDPRIIDYARSTYGAVEGLSIRRFDLLADRLDEPVDYVFANHFLHHLPNEEIIRLLRIWQPLVRRRMVFGDLLRDRLSYLGFSLLSLFYRNSFARHDGLVSIRRGFRAGELAALARNARPGLPCSIQRLAPGRLVLCMEGNSTEAPPTPDLCEKKH